MENAQIQYIGARYVTKIYENSQNPNSAEWEADTVYEPLTMVTYQNGSYLSKKQVPQTVGNPAANGTYWVQTGFYNGQIANLQNQIDSINAALSVLNATVGENSTNIDLLLGSDNNLADSISQVLDVALNKGVITAGTGSGSVECSPDTFYTIGEIELEAGNHLIMLKADCYLAATDAEEHKIEFQFDTNATVSSIGYGRESYFGLQAKALKGYGPYRTNTAFYCAIVNVATTTKYYLHIYDHTSGDAITVYPYIKAISFIDTGYGYLIPSFYRSYVHDRVQTVIANQNDDTTGLIFITDLHNSNRHFSTAMASYIMRATDVKKLVYGGDLIDQPATKALAIQQLTDRTNLCRVDENTIFLAGNHDFNPYGGGGTASLSSGELEAILNSGLNPDIVTNDKLYYYEDIADKKIRLLYLNTGTENTLDSAQISFVENALNLPADWTVVIMSHISLGYEGFDVRTSTNYAGSITQLATIINNAVPTIACWISGHNHIDMVNTTKFSFPIICFTCDASANQASTYSSDNRDIGTINEQSFNVVQINTNTKTIKVTRFGGGEYNALNDGYNANDMTLNY